MHEHDEGWYPKTISYNCKLNVVNLNISLNKHCLSSSSMNSLKSFIWFILLAYFKLICGHICFLEQLWDNENGQNVWILQSRSDDQCSCSKFLAKPNIMRSCGFNEVASGVGDKYWYTDKPGLFADRRVWETDVLQEMLGCLTHPPNDAEFETSELPSSLPPLSSPTFDISSTQQRTTKPTSSLLSSATTKPTSTEQVTDRPTTSELSFTTTSILTTPCSDDDEVNQCNPPTKLGMEDGTIPEQNLDSSSNDGSRTPNHGRLNAVNTYWRNAAGDGSPWIQATLLAVSRVHGILIQGFDTSISLASYASSIMIQTGLSISTLTYIRSSCDQPPITFTANDKTNALTPVNINFPRVVVATVIRLEPKDCYKYEYPNSQCTLRFEVLGCTADQNNSWSDSIV